MYVLSKKYKQISKVILFLTLLSLSLCSLSDPACKINEVLTSFKKTSPSSRKIFPTSKTTQQKFSEKSLEKASLITKKTPRLQSSKVSLKMTSFPSFNPCKTCLMFLQNIKRNSLLRLNLSDFQNLNKSSQLMLPFQ